VTGEEPLAPLLGAPCRVRDVRVGHIAGIYVDADHGRVIGLDVTCPEQTRRFLPWLAVEVDGGHVRADSALLLVDAGESYERLGARVIRDPAELAHDTVSRDGRLCGRRVVSTSRGAGTHAR
jgi:hypothetical protein